MKNLLGRMGLCLALFAGLTCQTQKPERKVEGTLLKSLRDPAVQIQLPVSAKYAGAERWILYGVADCELHAFAETDNENKVKALYWVQFEGYIPSRPDAKYEYDSQQHTSIGGMDFFVDTWVRSDHEQVRAGSDREHIESLIKAKGFNMPSGMMYVRLVHLLDAQKRKELMIIYGEDLASTAHGVEDLRPGGEAYSQWSGIANGLLANAKAKILVTKE